MPHCDPANPLYNPSWWLQHAQRVAETPSAYEEQKSKLGSLLPRLKALPGAQQRLIYVLSVFLVVTLVVILAPAIVGIVHVEWLKTWPWTPTLLYVASALLAITPTCVVLMAAWSIRAGVLALFLALALASPAIAAGPVRCTTYEEKTLGRLQTLCDDGTRSVSAWSPTLFRNPLSRGYTPR